MTATQLDLWATAVPEVHLTDVTWADEAQKALHRIRLEAQLIDCCTGLPCPVGYSRTGPDPDDYQPYGQGRCGRCGCFAAPGFIASDHDHPGTPCPGTVTWPAGTPRWQIIRAWQATPAAEHHAQRHDRKHWPDCARCGCPRGVHAVEPGHKERWPWSNPTRSWCRGCRDCFSWAVPGKRPPGLPPDQRHAWLERALTEAGLR